MMRRRKSKPAREEVRKPCPTCGRPMPFAQEDGESVTLSCHGWHYQAFGDKARLWRILHLQGVALAHEWDIPRLFQVAER